MPAVIRIAGTQAEIAAWRERMPRAFGVSRWVVAARWIGAALALAWFVTVLRWFDITPQRIWNGLDGLTKIIRLMIPPSPGEQWQDIVHGLAESVAMAFFGTFAAMVVAVPLGFLGARNVVVNTLAHFTIRRVFDGLRGMDQLIWALAFVRAVGLGPLAGVMAIFAAEVAVLAKLFAEAIENANTGETDAIKAVGGSAVMRVRFGLLPQVMPVMIAQFLYQFESNVRSASILGVVGAGGIGLQIAERIKVRYWDEVLFIILLIFATVAILDALSSRLRRRLIGI
jgi:phosphonate transport system permease protein